MLKKSMKEILKDLWSEPYLISQWFIGPDYFTVTDFARLRG